MATDRVILHVDMDAFFAAIEQLDNPALRGKPLIVAPDRPRGVVTTASYEARPYGCRSAQPVAVAKRLCPDLVIVPIRSERYREVSGQLFDLLQEFSPLVQPLSVDEAFLDMTGCEGLFGTPREMGMLIRKRIRETLSLTASVGVAPNMFLAKLASDFRKPDGLTVIEPGREADFLRDLPIARLWGVGPRTEEHLLRLGIRTVGQLANMSPEKVKNTLGEEGEHLWLLSRGIDDRPVTPDREAKSISHEVTFETDIPDPDEVRAVLLREVELVAARLRRAGLKTGSVTVKIRFGSFRTITRSRQMEPASNTTNEIWHTARELFDLWVSQSFQPVRLIGAAATRLATHSGQMPLFADPDRKRQQRLDIAADAVAQRFGKKAIRRGRTLP
ncbi:MAG TPA: DNA polymerase IV [Phycisphaeraceae bacterium]|nr:DNA polymerase IV [Phycisphaeraceae bacterium]